MSQNGRKVSYKINATIISVCAPCLVECQRFFLDALQIEPEIYRPVVIVVFENRVTRYFKYAGINIWCKQTCYEVFNLRVIFCCHNFQSLACFNESIKGITFCRGIAVNNRDDSTRYIVTGRDKWW